MTPAEQQLIEQFARSGSVQQSALPRQMDMVSKYQALGMIPPMQEMPQVQPQEPAFMPGMQPPQGGLWQAMTQGIPAAAGADIGQAKDNFIAGAVPAPGTPITGPAFDMASQRVSTLADNAMAAGAGLVPNGAWDLARNYINPYASASPEDRSDINSRIAELAMAAKSGKINAEKTLADLKKSMQKQATAAGATTQPQPERRTGKPLSGLGLSPSSPGRPKRGVLLQGGVAGQATDRKVLLEGTPGSVAGQGGTRPSGEDDFNLFEEAIKLPLNLPKYVHAFLQKTVGGLVHGGNPRMMQELKLGQQAMMNQERQALVKHEFDMEKLKHIHGEKYYNEKILPFLPSLRRSIAQTMQASDQAYGQKSSGSDTPERDPSIIESLFTSYEEEGQELMSKIMAMKNNADMIGDFTAQVMNLPWEDSKWRRTQAETKLKEINAEFERAQEIATLNNKGLQNQVLQGTIDKQQFEKGFRDQYGMPIDTYVDLGKEDLRQQREARKEQRADRKEDRAQTKEERVAAQKVYEDNRDLSLKVGKYKDIDEDTQIELLRARGLLKEKPGWLYGKNPDLQATQAGIRPPMSGDFFAAPTLRSRMEEQPDLTPELDLSTKSDDWIENYAMQGPAQRKAAAAEALRRRQGKR